MADPNVKVTPRDDGGPVYPCTKRERVFTKEAMVEANLPDAFAFAEAQHPGMSLRDYFAGQALALVLSQDGSRIAPTLAHAAYEIADAMLAERTK